MISPKLVNKIPSKQSFKIAVFKDQLKARKFRTRKQLEGAKVSPVITLGDLSRGFSYRVEFMG